MKDHTPLCLISVVIADSGFQRSSYVGSWLASKWRAEQLTILISWEVAHKCSKRSWLGNISFGYGSEFTRPGDAMLQLGIADPKLRVPMLTRTTPDATRHKCVA